jgi:hypothetical protein
MKRFLTFAFLIVAAGLAAAIATGCKPVTGNGGYAAEKNDPAKVPVNFEGSAEVNDGAPNILRLSAADGALLEVSGVSGLTLGAAGGLPAHILTATSPNGILGVAFDKASPNTALFLLDGWVEASDGNPLTLRYDDSGGGMLLNGAPISSFTIDVTNNVLEGTTGPVLPDASAPAPTVTKAAVYDEAPARVLVEFDTPVVINGLQGFSVEVNGAVKSEITGYSVSGAGLAIFLKYGIGHGDSAVLSYTKPATGRVISLKLRELENFSMPIENFVLSGTDPNGPDNPDKPAGPGGDPNDPADIPPGPPGAGAVLSGLHVTLPRVNWHQNEDLKPELTVIAVYSDSGCVPLNQSSGWTINPENPTAKVGDNQILTVSYRGRTGSVAINVKAAGAVLPALAALNVTVPRVNWIVGETFLPNVTAVYTDSSYGTVTSGYTLNPASPTATVRDGVLVTVSYTYQGVTKSGGAGINVKASKSDLPGLAGIAASVEKKTWALYEPFTVNVEASYSDGTKGVIPYGYILDPTAPTATPGLDKAVLVMFKGKQAPAISIDVVTKNEADAVTLSSISAVPAKFAWVLDEPFELTVTATYSNGTTGIIAKGYYIQSPEYPTGATGEAIAVNVVYKDKTDSFSIKVVASADLLDPLDRITAAPDKGSYNFSEGYTITVLAYYGASPTGHPISNWTSNPANITGGATGSVPVRVSYTERGVTKTADFTVTVNPLKIGGGGTGGEGTTVFDLTPHITKPVYNAARQTASGTLAYNLYTIDSITWYNAGDNAAFTAAKYAAAAAYKAVVVLTPKAGYTFAGIGANCFKHTNAQTGGVTNAADSGMVTIVFPATAGSIVTFDPKGGTWKGTYSGWTGTGNQTVVVEPNGQITLPVEPGQVAKAGNYLVSWRTADSASGTDYLQGSSFKPGAGVTLYARWDAGSSWVDKDAAQQAINNAKAAITNAGSGGSTAVIMIGNPAEGNADQSILDQIAYLLGLLDGQKKDVSINGGTGTITVTLYNTAAIIQATDDLNALVALYKPGVIIVPSWTFTYNGTNGTDGSVQQAKLVTTGTYEIELEGGAGGHLYTAAGLTAAGGKGGHAKGRYRFAGTSGSPVNLDIRVGGQGEGTAGYDGTGFTQVNTFPGGRTRASSHPGGYNGGGSGGESNFGVNGASGGGGATDVRLTGSVATLNGVAKTDPRIIVAGGGGGAAASGESGSHGLANNSPMKGGNAGGTSGITGDAFEQNPLNKAVNLAVGTQTNCSGSTGTASKVALGTAGIGANGILGQTGGRGGGGGGWWGGGAANAGASTALVGAGSGGSGYTGGTTAYPVGGGSTPVLTNPYNGASAAYTGPVNEAIPGTVYGSGKATIRWIAPPAN